MSLPVSLNFDINFYKILIQFIAQKFQIYASLQEISQHNYASVIKATTHYQ